MVPHDRSNYRVEPEVARKVVVLNCWRVPRPFVLRFRGKVALPLNQ